LQLGSKIKGDLMNQLATALTSAGFAAVQNDPRPDEPEQVKVLPWKIVVHEHPDTDAYVCAWAADKFIAKNDPCSLAFVRSGEQLPADEADGYRVLHMDTGFGVLDQHGKSLERASSFELLCEFYELTDDPGLEAILEMTRATDNVEKVPLTSVHYLLKGLHYHFCDRKTREVDWQACMDEAFTVLDILYGQARARRTSADDFARLNKLESFNNGIKFANLGGQARLREAAYNAGADVVLWTIPPDRKNSHQFNVGIQVHRDSPVKLVSLMDDLRRAEARQRGLNAKGHNLQAVGKDLFFGGWFLHDSLKLILNGSNSHPLELNEYTLLSRSQITNIVAARLSALQITK
jgi:hypothetical protein